MNIGFSNSFRLWKLLIVLVVVIACALVPKFIHNDYLLQVLFRIVLFAALGLAWNLVGGYAGQLSLGHVAFFGVGAYGLAIFRVHGGPVSISLLLPALVPALLTAIIDRILLRFLGPSF